MHTDIRYQDWIEKVPEQYRPYVYLARLDRPIGIWLLLLPGWWSILLASAHLSGLHFKTFWLLFLFFIGAIVMRAAGCVINDIWDRKLDADVERTALRPLASGEVSLMQALGFLCALLFAGFCILLMLSAAAIWLGLLCVPLIIAYPLMKRITFWPQAFLGLTINFGALMGWAAVMDALSPQAFLLYIGAALWTLGYDTIYAHQDKDDDALIGIKSTALKFGAESKGWVSIFFAGMVICLALALALSPVNFLALPGLALIAAHLFWQIGRWDMDDPESSLNVFKSNRDLGLIVLAVIFLSGF